MNVFLFAKIIYFRRFVLHEYFHHQPICLWEKLYTFVDLSCKAMSDEIPCHLKMLKRLKINDSNY